MTDPIDREARIFSGLRPRLFGIAYRMLGSAAGAEDVVQDVWLRWEATDRSAVRDPAAFLATATVRLAMNVRQSARSRRETYVGQWLPEPVDTSADPELGAERDEALELGVLRLLEQLRPAERAAYVLREAFDYPFAKIAEVLQVSEANARQLASRARKHLAGERRERVSAAEHRNLLQQFLAAAQTGDLAVLEGLFAEAVVSYWDGGGVVAAARRPIEGRAVVGMSPRRRLRAPTSSPSFSEHLGDTRLDRTARPSVTKAPQHPNETRGAQRLSRNGPLVGLLGATIDRIGRRRPPEERPCSRSDLPPSAAHPASTGSTAATPSRSPRTAIRATWLPGAAGHQRGPRAARAGLRDVPSRRRGDRDLRALGRARAPR